ncbi:MAG: hypothetical protein C0621_10550 [Desulfuromonas sp.]|nr:MAG: hypothetical protein C0621_10550 [Desulfuromonas sp.]
MNGQRRRHAVRFLLGTGLLVVLLVTSLLSSSLGTRLALRLVDALPGLTLRCEHIEGGLLGPLKLEGIELSAPFGTLSLDRLSFDWHPAALLQQRLDIEQLALGQGVLVLAKHEASTSSEQRPPFQIPDVLTRYNILLSEVTLGDLEIIRTDGRSEHWRQGSLALQLDKAQLSLEKLHLKTPYGALEAQGRSDLQQTSGELTLQFQASPPKPQGSLSLQWEKDEKIIRGHLEGELQRPPSPRLTFSSPFTMQEEILQLSALQLQREKQSGSFAGELTLALTEQPPRFHLNGALISLDLAEEFGTSTNIDADLDLAGSAEAYRGTVSLQQHGESWRDASFQLTLEGDRQQLRLPSFDGHWLGGRLSGDLSLPFDPAVESHLTLALREIDPARIDGRWKGLINADLRGHLARPADAAPTLILQGGIHDSILRGQPLHGDLDLRLQRGDLIIQQIALAGDGFFLEIGGKLKERISLVIDIPRIGKLYPAGHGSLRAEGWLQHHRGRWNSAFEGSGEQLQLGKTFQVAHAALNATWDGESESFILSGDGREIIAPLFHATSLTLRGEGDLGDHTLNLQSDGEEGEVRLALHGGWSSPRWQGEITELSSNAPFFGPWRLTAPTPLTLSGNEIAVAEVSLQGSTDEMLQGSAHLIRSTHVRALDLSWRALDLSRSAQFGLPLSLEGRSNGRLKLQQQGEAITLATELTADGSVHSSRFNAEELQLQFSAAADADGSSLKTTLTRKNTPLLTLDFASSAPLTIGRPEQGTLTVNLQQLPLDWGNTWLATGALRGELTGDGSLRWQPQQLAAEGTFRASGDYRQPNLDLPFAPLTLQFAGDESGSRAELALKHSTFGALSAALHAPAPLRRGPPPQGTFTAHGERLDLARLAPFFPPALTLNGQLFGELQGDWHNRTFRLESQSHIENGDLTCQMPHGEAQAKLQQATLASHWTAQGLELQSELQLDGLGALQAEATLPLLARLPLQLERTTPLTAQLRGDLHAEGLLTALLPSLIRESRVALNLNLGLDGTIETPHPYGTIRLRDGGGYLPTLGIRLEKGSADLHLDGESITLTPFSIESQGGRLEGEGGGTLEKGALKSYRLQLRGSHFTLINLPELQLLLTPELEATGSLKQLTLRGKVTLDEMLLRGRKPRTTVGVSPDLVIVGIDPGKNRRPPFALDLDVDLMLGDQVLVQAAGLDAKLAGKVKMKGENAESIVGHGKVDVVKGAYAAYGMHLEIEKGSLLFAGGPISEPALDILALRPASEVRVGVQVAGTPRRPKVTLFSDPSMPDTDILSYIVLGRPLGNDSGQVDLLSTAAGALLAQGESVMLQERLKRRIGLDVFEVRSGSSDENGAADSIVTIGKYLTPDLYIGMGRSLFARSNEFSLRYRLSHRWEVESTLSEESGADLYYLIEFD